MGGEFTYPKMVPLVLTHSHIGIFTTGIKSITCAKGPSSVKNTFYCVCVCVCVCVSLFVGRLLKGGVFGGVSCFLFVLFLCVFFLGFLKVLFLKYFFLGAVFEFSSAIHWVPLKTKRVPIRTSVVQ